MSATTTERDQAVALEAMNQYCQLGDPPPEDAGYFALLTKTIFRAGLNWQVIENKWPAFEAAFARFDADAVADYQEADADRLVADRSIVRNYKKILATIDNAVEIQKIRVEHGSFQHYLAALARDGEGSMVKALSKRFAHLGESTSVTFLRSVGYEMPEHALAWHRRHTAARR